MVFILSNYLLQSVSSNNELTMLLVGWYFLKDIAIITKHPHSQPLRWALLCVMSCDTHHCPGAGYYDHFTNEETEAQGGQLAAWSTHLENDGDRNRV
jgi:hypothetical protein